MKTTLRPYQEQLISRLRGSITKGHLRIIGVLPTGGGKTFTFSFIVKSAWERGRKCLILTDRVELMTQAGGALKEVGLDPLRIEAGKKPYLGGSLYVGMVETIARRVTTRKDYQHWLNSMDIIIIDECHMRSFTKLFDYFNPKARVIGFTATPERVGKKDQLAEQYTDLCVGVEINYLVNEGYLAKPNYYGVEADLQGVKSKMGDYDQNQVADRFSQNKLYKGVVQNWKEQTPNTKTLVFSSNIASSKELVEEFISNGYDAKHLDAKMPAGERARTLEWFHNNPKGILCNVGILTKGFDEPSIETVVLYRATKSLSLYLQMVGRGSRIHQATGKTEFNVLDFGNNILNHGFWHEERQWELKLKSGAKRALGEAVLKNCPACDAFIPAQATTCPECNHDFPKLRKEQEFAKLQLLDPREVWKTSQAKTLEERAEMAKKKLIKPFRVIHNLKHYEDVKKFVNLMGWSPYWMQYNHQRFWWSDAYLAEVESGTQVIKILDKAV